MLESINTPADVRKLSFEQLSALAADIRNRIIEVTSKNGGHIAPSLGVTDLTVALLKVFDPLENRIVWDVGHQSYAYKILTGRNNRFDTLRQLNGISGFNNVKESKYDAFGVGHSSTSISAALGITVAKELQKQKGKTIAIIGDGALTGGMALEALNHAGHLQREMIVILNDNEMSISKNVGALQNYLTNMLVSRSYNKLKEQVWSMSMSLPQNIRSKFIYGAQKLEESLINILVPNIIFEDLGFKYVGPVNGHDISRLVRIFHKVKTNVYGPVLIHVVTQKGKGYSFAESNAERFHGLGPFEKETGKVLSDKNSLSYSAVFGNKMIQLAEKNKKICAISAAMTDGTGLIEFKEKFPDRLFDVGIAEQHAVTFAAGMAISGLKPFCAIYSTFLQRALDQIIHDVALQKLAVVFCLDRAGIVGEDGATHHGVFDLSYLKFIPNLVIMAPAYANEFEQMLEFAANYQDGPIAIRYPRGTARYKDNLSEVEFPKFDLVCQGSEFALIGIGKAFFLAEALAEKLRNEKNLNPVLINPRFLKPLDLQMLEDISTRVNTVITIEDNALIGGFGSEIKDYFCNSKVKVHCYGIPDSFVTHGNTEALFQILGLTPEQIFKDLCDKQII